MLDINEVADRIYRRWKMSARPTITCKGELGELLSITVGLGSIFNEDENAEFHWINTFNRRLNGTPRTLILQGRFKEVLDVVNAERHL